MPTADTPSPTPPGADAPRLSWRERELLAALRRLANARSQVAVLEEELAAQEASGLDAGAIETIEAHEAELVRLRRKGRRRFARSARDRASELETQQRLVLARLDFESYEALRAARVGGSRTAVPIDPAFLDFARRELADAERAYQQMVELPEPGPR
jgi:hypothetical protein